MSVSATHSRDNYLGNNAVDTYAWTFYVQSTSELEVTKAEFTLDDDLTTKIWTETDLAINTDFTATRSTTTGKGSITLSAGNLGTGFRLSIRRKMPVTQEVDIKNAATFDPRVHETALDRGTYVAQQIQDDVDRCVKLHVTDADGSFDASLPPAADENPTACLAVNAAGDGFTWGPTTTDLSNAATAASDAAASAAASAASAADALVSENAASASAASAAASAAEVSGIEKRLLFTVKGPYTTTQTLETTGQLALCDTSAGSWTVTLPPAINMNDVRLVIKKTTTDVNVLTVEGDGSDTIDGELNIEISYQFGYVQLVADGVNSWHVIA